MSREQRVGVFEDMVKEWGENQLMMRKVFKTELREGKFDMGSFREWVNEIEEEAGSAHAPGIYFLIEEDKIKDIISGGTRYKEEGEHQSIFERLLNSQGSYPKIGEKIEKIIGGDVKKNAEIEIEVIFLKK